MQTSLFTLLKWIDRLSIFVGKTASWLIIPIVLLQVYEALARYFFKSPTIWTWELALLMYGVHFFLGGAWVLQENRHVRTDVLIMKLSPRLQALLEVLLFCTVFAAFMYVMVSLPGIRPCTPSPFRSVPSTSGPRPSTRSRR